MGITLAVHLDKDNTYTASLSGIPNQRPEFQKLFELKLNYFVKHAEEPTHIFMSRYVYHSLMQLHDIERYCEFPHMTGGNPLKLLGMTVIITVGGADNQVFLNSSSNMFLSD